MWPADRDELKTALSEEWPKIRTFLLGSYEEKGKAMDLIWSLMERAYVKGEFNGEANAQWGD